MHNVNVHDSEETLKSELKEFVTMKIGHQNFGISVDYVVDVLFPQKINPIPLASNEIVGSLNLRGRIVTALDIRVLLDIHEPFDLQTTMCVVVEHNNELFSLIVDEVGDVVSLPIESLIKNPDNMSKYWQEVSHGIFPMKEELLVILDINKVMLSLIGS